MHCAPFPMVHRRRRPNHRCMSVYRRAHIPGGCFFFTVVTRKREPWPADADADAMQRLRQAFRETMRKRPFSIDAIVVLPEHLHAIWRLPPGDADFSTRWRLIKHSVSVTPPRQWHWQPRLREHILRDENDWRRHVEYIHYNRSSPVTPGRFGSGRTAAFAARWSVDGILKRLGRHGAEWFARRNRGMIRITARNRTTPAPPSGLEPAYARRMAGRPTVRAGKRARLRHPATRRSATQPGCRR